MINVTRTILLLALLFAVASCSGGSHTFQCTDNESCNLKAGGVCLSTSTGNSWCAYPDQCCPSGYRYSEQDVGDGLAGTCTPGMRYTLTVMIGGNGSGTVTSAPEGLTCTSGMCTGKFDEGTLVQLSPVATSGEFLGWSNECNGQGACSVTMDQDRSVSALFGIPGEALWAKQFGSTGLDRGYAIAVDGDDNLIVVGEFTGTITAGTNTLTSAGMNDIFVMKLASGTGDVIWAKQFGDTGRDQGFAVAVDATNNVYVSGRFEATVDFGGGDLQSAGMYDAFVLKLASNGDFGWARRFGGANFDSAPAIAARDNVVVVAGAHVGNITVDTTTLMGSGSFDIFVVSMAQDTGATNFAKSYGGAGGDLAAGVAIDSSGNIVVTGTFDGSANYGGSLLQSAGISDVFLLKVAGSDGAHLLSKSFGAANTDTARGIDIDANGAIFLVGEFRDSVSFGCTNTLTAGQTGSADVFLVKFTQAGACQWAKSFTGTGTGSLPRYGNAVTVNASGDVAIAGSFCDSITFGGGTFSSASACPSNDVYTARFKGTDGSHLNSVRAGGTGVEAAYGVGQAADGRFFMTGDFQGFAEFGGQAFTSAGSSDVFVLGLAPL